MSRIPIDVSEPDRSAGAFSDSGERYVSVPWFTG
jgi:hypothetical protein